VCPGTKPKITGRVTDKTGVPVAGLAINFKYKYALTGSAAAGAVGPAEDVGSAVTDANGDYVVPDLSPGVYWVEPTGDPGGPDYWNPPARHVEVREADVGGQGFQRATAARRYSLTVWAINQAAGYQPIAGETIRLVRAGINTWYQQTDDDGNAVFSDLWPGVYYGFPPDESAYTYEPDSVTFILTADGTNRGFNVTPK